MSNLQQRVITALCLVIGLSGVLFFFSAPLAIMAFVVIAVCAAWEWGGLMGQPQSARIMYALSSLPFFWQIDMLQARLLPVLFFLSAVFWLLLAPVWLWRKWTLRGNDFFGYAIGFILILPTWAGMVYLYSKSPWLLIATMAIVWVADIGAYFTGRALGRHKLAPNISPGKTWEGVAGAVASVIAYGLVWVFLLPQFVSSLVLRWLPEGVAGMHAASLLLFFSLLIALTGVSVVGDLFESLLKRQAGLKDSSGLLPGHGGVLDRIDSLMASLPLVAGLLYFFA
jgi:phosphatidate cytidylyltransferase